MTLVAVVRDFSDAPDLHELQARENAVGWCLEQYDVRFLHTYWSRDRLRMACIYEAPDAEAVRRTQREAGLPVARLLPVVSFAREVLGGPPDHDVGDKTLVIAERTLPETVTADLMRQSADEGTWCFDAHHIDVVDSYMHIGGHNTLCLFAAPDAESVRTAFRTLHTPADQVWAATFHEASDD